MSLIKASGAGEQSTGFYKHLLDQSLKFDDGNASVLKRTPAAAGNRKIWTWSAWIKFGAMSHGTNQITLFDASSSSSEQHGIVYSGQQFYVFGYTSGFTYRKMLNALHRDPSAWYHYVVAFDTTDGTAGDRIKIYVNGTLQTSFAHSTNPDEDYETGFNNAVAHGFGARLYDGANYFDGYMAEINFIDGTALTAASFGETKDGIWIPKDTSGLTFGNQGFHLTFKDDVISEGFNAVTYTGNAATQSVSGLGFSPGMVWVKSRDGGQHHNLFDVLRSDSDGPRRIYPSLTSAEESTIYSGTTNLTSIDGDGFSMGDGVSVNENNKKHVAWCWEAGGTPTADNSASAGATPTAGSVKIDGSNLGSALAGSIAATRLSANTTKGFSVVTYTGTGSAATVAHGLGATPKWMIIKNRGVATWWTVYHTSLGATKYVRLNSTSAEIDNSNVWNDTEPTSSVFTVATVNDVNASGNTYVAYCWTDISGYSKFGSYTGNGSTTGPTVTTGFSPAWVMYKRTSGTGDWGVLDNTRDPANPISLWLGANIANAESHEATRQLNFLSTGFQPTGTNSDVNADGDTYIYMAFADTREAAFFKDVTTNGNNFTPVNLDYRDSVPDTPTNNFATFNPLNSPAAAVLSEGNTKFTQTSNDRAAIGNMAMSSGKWYYEVYYTAGSNPEAGLARIQDSFANSGATGSSDKFLYITNGTTFRTPAWTATDNTGVSAQTSETILGFAVDADNGKAFISVNGTYINSGDPAAGSNPQATFDADWVTQTGGGIVPFIGVYTGTSADVRINFGQDSSFSGVKATSNANADGEGHGSFQYAPPSGFLALCSQNLPDVEIIDGSENFVPYVYTANNASTRDFTGIGFAPDFLWFKDRTTAFSHALYDTVRGVNKGLQTNGTGAENTYPVMTAFGDDGFSTATDAAVAGNILNNSTDAYVAWAWLAGTAFSNDASATSVGTIDSAGQVNTKAGFSIIGYTGTGSAGTIAHGLSAAPEMLIIKERNATSQWVVGHHNLDGSAPFDKGLYLDDTRALYDDASNFNDTAPTSTVFSVGTGGYVNTDGNTFICYAFHSVEGYSKVGSFSGNNNADGAFVYTGFRPAWIMTKSYGTGGTNYDWVIFDNRRNTFNVSDAYIDANLTAAEVASGRNEIDILSNGFKCRSSYGDLNSSTTYIYLAFADQPFKFANAR